jgi:glycosyltransferase involved in cell wall biosynthesis
VKILISSHAFAPNIGGIETVTGLLATEFVQLGQLVKVVTQTPSDATENRGYSVIRQPSVSELVSAVRWCDLLWQNNLSLRTLWPGLLLRKPVVISHQGSYCRAPAGISLVERLKHAVVRCTTSVAISQAVAACFKTDSTIIPNPYDARRFSLDSSIEERPRDLVFLGRLVSEKGIDVLLEALAKLRAHGLSPKLTIVGVGPEFITMEQMVEALGLKNQVIFAGLKRDKELVTLLRQHKVLVVPSSYDEPFGVVALEGIACGCVVVGSAGGGLPEAIGPCGITVPNGDADALAQALEQLLLNPNERKRFLFRASEHLARFHPRTIAETYLTLFHSKLS